MKKYVVSVMTLLLAVAGNTHATSVVKIESTVSLMPVMDPGISGEALPALTAPKKVAKVEGTQVASLTPARIPVKAPKPAVSTKKRLDQLIVEKKVLAEKINHETLASLSYKPNLKPFNKQAEEKARKRYVHSKRVVGKLIHATKPAPKKIIPAAKGVMLFDGSTAIIKANSAANDVKRMNIRFKKDIGANFIVN